MILAWFRANFCRSQGSIGHFGHFTVDFWHFGVVFGWFWANYGRSEGSIGPFWVVVSGFLAFLGDFSLV